MYVNNTVYKNFEKKEKNLKDAKRSFLDELKLKEEKARQVDASLDEIITKQNKEMDIKLEGVKGTLEDELSSLDTEIRLNIGRMNVENKQKIDAIKAELSQVKWDVDNVNRKVEKVTKEINDRFAEIQKKLKSNEEKALVYKISLKDCFDKMKKLYGELLLPNEVNEIGESIRFIQEDIEEELYVDAIALAQGKIVDATKYYAELEIKNERFKSLCNKIRSVEEQINQYADIPYEEMASNDGSVPEEENVKYWSDGVHKILIENYNVITADEVNYEKQMDIEGLQISYDLLNKLLEDFQACSDYALRRVEDFNALVSVAETLTNIMESEGWTETGCKFVDGDYRKNYIGEFDNGAGQDAVLEVLSCRNVNKVRLRNGKTEYETGDIEFVLNLYGYNEEGARIVWEEIISNFNGGGVTKYEPKGKESMYEEYEELREKRINNMKQVLSLDV